MTDKPESSRLTTAYTCHLILAILVLLILLVQIDLLIEHTEPQGIAAAAFLVFMYLALPVLLLGIVATYNSIKAADDRLLVTTCILIALAFAAVFLSNSIIIVTEISYITLVFIFYYQWRQERST